MNSSTDRRARTHTAEPLPAPAEGHPPAGRAIGPMSTLVEPDATQTWAAGAAIVWMAAAASGKSSTPTSVVATSHKADLFRSRCTGQRS